MSAVKPYVGNKFDLLILKSMMMKWINKIKQETYFAIILFVILIVAFLVKSGQIS